MSLCDNCLNLKPCYSYSCHALDNRDLKIESLEQENKELWQCLELIDRDICECYDKDGGCDCGSRYQIWVEELLAKYPKETR